MAMPLTPKPAKPSKRGLNLASHLALLPGDLHTQCTYIWTGIKADSNRFKNPYPPASEVEPELDTLYNAVKSAVSGDPAAVQAAVSAANDVRKTFVIACKYVERTLRKGASNEVQGVLANLGLSESRVGMRSPKPELEVREGATSTIALLIALAVDKAVSYTWEYSSDKLTWTISGQTGQADTMISGLTPGKVYYFRFRVLLRDRTVTDPSQVVEFMVK